MLHSKKKKYSNVDLIIEICIFRKSVGYGEDRGGTVTVYIAKVHVYKRMQILRTLNHYQAKSFALKYIFKSLIFTKKILIRDYRIKICVLV